MCEGCYFQFNSGRNVSRMIDDAVTSLRKPRSREAFWRWGAGGFDGHLPFRPVWGTRGWLKLGVMRVVLREKLKSREGDFYGRAELLIYAGDSISTSTAVYQVLSSYLNHTGVTICSQPD